jgi:chemotaxis protein MotB
MTRGDARLPRLGAPRRPVFDPPAPAKDESEVRWLISYSDFMMQLVCLFILLFSVSAMDKGKTHPIAQAWRQQVGVEPINAVSDSTVGTRLPLTVAQIPGLLRDIEVVRSRHPDGGAIRVYPESDGFKLQLIYEMFDEGSGRPSPRGERLLDLAALILKPYEGRLKSVEIVGHTAAGDADRKEGSALRLSMTRAREALRYVTSTSCPNALDPARLEAGGRGPHEPVADNADPRARALNRRVEFVARVFAK